MLLVDWCRCWPNGGCGYRLLIHVMHPDRGAQREDHLEADSADDAGDSFLAGDDGGNSLARFALGCDVGIDDDIVSRRHGTHRG